MRFQSELVYWFGQWERALVAMPNIYTQMIFWDIQTDISPRHAKVYRDFKSEFERLQNERVGAFKEFIEDVNNGNFPEETHLVRMQQDELAKFRELLDKI